ncbi:MAG: AI-2E family transporter [Candidatus Dormibacteraeota bacterium]|nr:AI-2E family transporter [Candidatus Dormibacteraeota bacterium]
MKAGPRKPARARPGAQSGGIPEATDEPEVPEAGLRESEPADRPEAPRKAGTPSPEPAGAEAAGSSTHHPLGWFWFRAAAIAVALFYGYQLLLVVRGWVEVVLDVLFLCIFGLVLSLIVQPFVEGLQRHARMPRAAAILSVLASLLLLLSGALYLLAGPLVSEASSLSRELPALLQRAQSAYLRLQADVGLQAFGLNPRSLVNLGAGTIASNILPLLVGGLQTTVKTLVDVVVVLVVAFWLLKDGVKMREEVLRWLPAGVREHVSFGFEAVAAVLGGYVRAQLMLALAIGAMAGLGSYLLGVPFPILVGLAAGIFELVPIVGPFAGGAVGVALALTRSPLLAAATVVLFLGIHVLEGYILAPRLQAQFTRIPTLFAFLAVFAGIEVGGFLGALFAVPATSLLFLFVRAALGDWRATRPDLFEQRGPSLNPRHRRILAEFRPHLLRRIRRRLRKARAAEPVR